MIERTPFGRYRPIELLGHGVMGEVWRAYDTETQRVVAVKVLSANGHGLENATGSWCKGGPYDQVFTRIGD